MNAFKRMLRNAGGATLVEYAAMLALIALVSIVLVTTLGSRTNGLFAPINSNWNGL